MNISHEWLQRFVPHTLGPEGVRDLITAHVATVEGFERLRADLAPFVVARVVESEKIPETKLSFNKVDDGSGTLLEVVCGAPNVTVGTLYPFARTGTVMPAGLTIEKRKIRGFTSNGMLCSARELGLGEDHDGILPLETDAPPGTPLLRVLPIGDVRLVVDVLPNRPDLLSHIGVAREVAALTGVAVGVPDELASLPPVAVAPVVGATEASAAGLTVRVASATDCARYTAAVIRGVTVGPSPAWLKGCVEAVGGRSINNVVDATNYMLHGYGQPMHAFDATTLSGDTIVVRRARSGESLVTLDGVERKLTPEMLVIADGERPTALAGVMGGRASEVREETTSIVLEVATFAAPLVRATRRAAGLSTDASYRFERGIDDAAVPEMLSRAAALLVAVAGGTVEGLVQVGVAPTRPRAVTLRTARVEQLLGDAIPADEQARLLRSVGFAVEPEGAQQFRVIAPSWRHDVEGEVDLIEEIARLRGFDRLPDALSGARPGTVPDHPLFVSGLRVRDALVAEGLSEVRPLPFTADAGEAGVRVLNPLGEDEPFLRSSVLDTLARRAEYNLSRMQGNLRLFEIGSVFARVGAGLPREEVRVGALLMGASRPPHFTEPQPPSYDLWDAKSLAERVARVAFPSARITVEPAEAPQLWTVMADGVPVGAVHRVTLDAPVWASAAYGVELTLGVMGNAPVAAPSQHAYGEPFGSARNATSARSGGAPVQFRPLPTTPAAEFDLALLVPEQMAAADVEQVLRRSGGELLERVELFDEFRGGNLPAGVRSVAWRLTFRHPERTLRDKEIEGRRSQLLKTLESQLGVRPRTA